MAGNLLIANDADAHKIYKHDGFSTTISDSIVAPDTDPHTLSWDGTNLYSGDYGTEKVFQHTGFSTTLNDSFTVSTGSWLEGICWSVGNLVTNDRGTAKAYQYDGFSTTIDDSFGMSGGDERDLAWDGNNILNNSKGVNKIFKYKGFSSTVRDSLPTAASDGRGLAWDSNNVIQEDNTTDKMYKNVGFTTTLSDSISVIVNSYGPADDSWDGSQASAVEKTQTIQAKAGIKLVFNKTLTAKGRIAATIEKTIQSKGDIKGSTSRLIDVNARIGDTAMPTISAKGNIKATISQTVTSKGNLNQNITQSLSCKGNVRIIYTDTISAKGRIYGANPTVRTVRTLARINPSQAFINEVDKTVRQISRKLEIQWDGVNWTDESVYLINAQGNEKLSKTSGEGIASVLDVDLDNTDERFTPNNTSSPICAYIKPRVNIRLSIIMGSYTYRMFTGYIKNIHPDTRSRVCSLECFDNQVLVYNKKANGVVYEDERSDQLLTTLAGLADLTSDQFDFDIGTLIVNFGYFSDRNVWPVMGELAVAERGRVFFDRHGILKFWNRNRLHNRGYNITLTLNDWISDLDYSVSEHEIKNAVVVQATPRASAGVQVVWTSGNAEYLNPYSDTLVWIPAGNSQVAWLELEDPCTTFITPIRNIDFTANSTQDGSGDDLTNNIEIHEFINYGNAVYITVGNIGDTDAYLTKFQVRGNPARILKWIRVTAKDQPSIDRYGRQDFLIENNFIQDEDGAIEIANEELWRRKDMVNLFRINIIGIPYLLCGDVVRVEYRSSEYDNYMIDQLDWTLDDNGFKQKLTLVNPYIFPTIQRVNARGYIVKYHQSKTTTSKGRIRAAKSITAKGNIFANTSKTIETFGNIV